MKSALCRSNAKSRKSVPIVPLWLLPIVPGPRATWRNSMVHMNDYKLFQIRHDHELPGSDLRTQPLTDAKQRASNKGHSGGPPWGPGQGQ